MRKYDNKLFLDVWEVVTLSTPMWSFLDPIRQEKLKEGLTEVFDRIYSEAYAEGFDDGRDTYHDET